MGAFTGLVGGTATLAPPVYTLDEEV